MFSCSSPSSYDVFLSFRGKDTRNNFMSHLYSALKRNQIKTYLDEKTLERGDDLSRALPGAIKKSKISIIIFSENFAFSSWCLRELVHILECRQQNKHVVIPIFYKVDLSDIKDQKGSYGKAFAKHEERLKDKMDFVQKWREALIASVDLSGWAWNSQDTRSEAQLIKEIVEDVSSKLGRMRYSSYVNCKGLVGIERHFSNINQRLLCIGSPDLRIVGIWGSSGVGKTTLASAIFAEHYYKFESCYFLENVREESLRQGLANLRNKLINKLFKESEEINLGNPFLLPHVRSKLSYTKVLIVLDDVNDHEQLNVLLLGRDSFGPGSRIIVTTRDAKLFRDIKVCLYELRRSKLKAFGVNSPTTDHIKRITNKVVNMQCVSTLLVLLLVFLMITLSWVLNSATCFPRFQSYEGDVYYKETAAVFNNIYNFFPTEKTTSDDHNMSSIPILLVPLLVFLMMTLSWVLNLAKYFPRFKSYEGGVYYKKTAAVFNNIYNFFPAEKTTSDDLDNMSSIPIFLVPLLIFSMILQSWVQRIAKCFPGFKSYVQSRLVFEDSSSRVVKGLDAEAAHKPVPQANNRDSVDDDGSLRRDDVEMVMGKLGFFFGRDSEELRESIGSDELSTLFEESEPSLEEIKEAFDVFDQNKDGFIDAEELQRVLCLLGLKKGTKLENCKKMIGNYDINRDGRIDYNEFVIFMETTFY